MEEFFFFLKKWVLKFFLHIFIAKRPIMAARGGNNGVSGEGGSEGEGEGKDRYGRYYSGDLPPPPLSADELEAYEGIKRRLRLEATASAVLGKVSSLFLLEKS